MDAIARVSTFLGGNLAQQILLALDGGSGPAFMEVYDGVIPLTPNTSVGAATILGTLVLSDPCGTVSGKVLTFGPITTGIAVATGVGRFARLYDSNMAPHLDVNISVIGGGGSLTLSSTAISAGGPIRVESLYIAFS